ncbi:hypothetical protein RM574_20280 [Streptomyces sp. DSM 41982]|uniref:Integral membrane protein n=1 Tax=Streptomyces evansiae TaxID=3075535 RepID=A0ABD5E9E1_9ACTN|nr:MULTISPECIES: hypothetical protein [unclassified Streptomyces]MDT0417822.1 hypothetical protein [Streptomyces sp. DSM 41982]SCE11279.1 hypothetical protein GA0115246_1109013 [Streptomyces sp. SolWspMP-sol7th]
MNSRTRARLLKTGAHTVQIPRTRGRRGHAPYVVVVPERPSLTHEATSMLLRWLWRSRTALAPTGTAVGAFLLGVLLHLIAPWAAWLLALLAAAPLVWLALAHRARPAHGPALAWRTGLVVLALSTLAQLAASVAYGPLAGGLGVWWLLNLLVAQTVWPVLRRTR